jgi:hypothetical protein
VIPDPAVKHLRVLASDLVLPETPRELLTQKASSNTGLQTEEKYIISKLRNTSEEVASDLLGPSSYHLLEHEENRSGNNPVAAGGADLEPVACEQPAKDGFIADFSSPSLGKEKLGAPKIQTSQTQIVLVRHFNCLRYPK